MVSTFLALLAVGCGYPYDGYANDVAEVACAKYDECNKLDYWGGTYETCLDYYAAYTGGVEDDAADECPNYDPGAARDCVADWEELTCAQLEEGMTPAACDSVCSAGTDAQ